NFVIDTGIHTVPNQSAAGHDQIDTQATPGVILETAAAIVEPAEPVIHGGVHVPECIHQSPTLERLHPFTLFRQKAALAGPEPSLGVGLTYSDIAVLRRNVHVTHHHNALSRVEALLKVCLQISIEAGLGRKLDRVGAVFTLGEITIEHDQRLAIGARQGRADHATLGIITVFRKPLAYPQRFITGQQRDTIVPLLAMVVNVITKGLYA